MDELIYISHLTSSEYHIISFPQSALCIHSVCIHRVNWPQMESIEQTKQKVHTDFQTFFLSLLPKQYSYHLEFVLHEVL